MQIKRKYGDNKDLDFTINLTDYYGKTAADIVDIIFVVKEKRSAPDNQILLKRFSDGNISFTGTVLVNVLVNWASNEYDNFKFNRKYDAGLFPKFIGDTVADENTDYEFELTIIEDLVQDN